MDHRVFRYLKNNFPSDPLEVDRLFISAYLEDNSIQVSRNTLLKQYQIERDDSDEHVLLINFLEIVHRYIEKVDLEALIELFEFVISPEDRIVNGAVYTPSNVRDYIVRESLKRLPYDDELAVADISCGCGGFLFTVAQSLHQRHGLKYYDIFRLHLYGLDIKEYAIQRTKLLLTLLAVTNGEDRTVFKFNLFTGDALNFKFSTSVRSFNGFDAVVGNPPYVCSRNISEETKQHLSFWSVCATGHPDLYIPFFQIGVGLLKDGGKMGYITMNSFFRSLNGTALRRYLRECALKMKIIDFGNVQIFKGKSTYTCICIFQNKKGRGIQYIRKNDSSLKHLPKPELIPMKSLNDKLGWNLQNPELLNLIEQTGTPLGELFQTKSGIATLMNDVYIYDPTSEDDEFYTLHDDRDYLIEKAACRNVINPNKLSKSSSIDHITQKIIFPYTYEDGSPKVLDEPTFSGKFPRAYEYLKSKKSDLATRDKGEGVYPEWYAYGRSQSLEKVKHQLFFPHITKEIPNYAICDDEDLLFYNGLGLVAESEETALFFKKLLSSSLFWFYIVRSSKPYGSGFYSMSRRYIKGFGVPAFSRADIDYVLSEDDRDSLDTFFLAKYGIEKKAIQCESGEASDAKGG